MKRSHVPWLTLALAATSVAVQWIPGVSAALEFNRAAITAGEWWRLVTAHVTHFDGNHLAWDVAVLVALGTVVEPESRARTATALGLAGIAITASVGWWQPQFENYRGLSGLDCALFGVFAGRLLLNASPGARVAGAIGLLGAAAKAAVELKSGATLFAIGATYAPVPLAHLIGLLAGVVTALVGGEWTLTFLRRKSDSPDPRPCP